MRWTDDLVREKILYAAELLKIDRLPTQQELINVYGNTALTNQITKRGGMQHWANKLNLRRKDCSSERSRVYEALFIKQVKEKAGLESQQMKDGFPYDVLTNKSIKVEVKMGHLSVNQNGTIFNTFNIRKENPTCDLYVFYCLDNHDRIVKVLIVPAAAIAGKKQVSVSLAQSKWDSYEGQWVYFLNFAEFNESIVKKIEAPNRKPRPPGRGKEVS